MIFALRLKLHLIAGFLCVLSGFSSALQAQERTAIFQPDASSVTTRLFGDVDVALSFDTPVPYRIGLTDGAPRLVLDFKGAHWGSGVAGLSVASRMVVGAGTGQVDEDWARLVLAFEQPMKLKAAQMENGILRLRLSPGKPARVQAYADPLLPPPLTLTRNNATPVVAIDAGHGGIDPGAGEGGLQEKQVVLTFARELARALNATGRVEAVLTRDSDTFLGLNQRVERAREAGARVFLSIHADSIDDPNAHGATVYTLSRGAADRLSERLAAQQNRALLLKGTDLSGAGDDIASVLIDMALRDTQPRAKRLASHLTEAIASVNGERRRRDNLSAGFQVLTAPDFPSALIELGFMSHEGDRRRFASPEWRDRMTQALAKSVLDWVEEDRAQVEKQLR